jgi:hypothetical protein
MFSQAIGATSYAEESVQIRHKIFHEKVKNVAPSDKLIKHKQHNLKSTYLAAK